MLEIPHGREQFIISGSLNQQTLANCHDILTFRREATIFNRHDHEMTRYDVLGPVSEFLL